MEQQAFYIVFAIVGMAIVGIVFWAATYSSRNDYDDNYRNRGGYPPPYYPPYPPQYPPQRESPIVTILGMGLVVFMLIAGMQYCGRMEEQKNQGSEIENEDMARDGEIIIGQGEETGDGQPEGKEEFRPQEYAVTDSTTAVDIAAPSLDPHYGYFVQISASDKGQSTLEDAKALLRTYPNQVFIGEHVNDSTGYPYKLLIGPYATEEDAKSAHGRNAVIYRPASEGVQIYNPR